MADYSYQAEKLAQARCALMLPHTGGQDAAIAEAFRICALGFYRMNEADLDDNARTWVRKIKDLEKTSQLGSLTSDQQLELSRTVSELADWFGREDRGAP